MVKNFMKNKKLLLGSMFCIWLLVCMVFTPVYTTVTLNFAEDPGGEVITTVFSGFGKHVSGHDARYRVVNYGVARISYLDIQYGSHCSLKRIDPLDQYYNREEPLSLTGLTISKNGIRVIELTGEELSSYFSLNDDMKLLHGDSFTFQVTGQDPQMLPNNSFQELYLKTPFSVRLLGGLIFGIGICFFAFLFWWFLRITTKGTLFFRCTTGILFGGVLCAAFLCIYTGFRNPFYLNPDEYHTLSAIRYYFSHFMPPSMLDPDIIDTYAIYGTTRHSEWSLFYFLTAKIGQFFTDEIIRMRLFTTITFCAMMGIVLKNIKKNSALLYAVLLTPQVWYLFSYCTSDSFDFFMSFLCLYELIKEDSMLNQVIGKPFCRKHILYTILLGLLFVQILWGKQSFYPVLIFVFLILLIRLFYTDRAMRKSLFYKYMAIAGMTLFIFCLRYMITDYPYYGFGKYTVYMDMLEKTALYEYRFSTPPMERAYSMSFMAKGVSLEEFLTKFEFNKNLFRTFAGFFGSYAFGARDWYYLLMGMLYLSFLGYVIFKAFVSRNKRVGWEIGAALLTMLIHYILIVYNAWVIDFQPQGRYLLPILIYAAYLAYRADKKGEDKFLRTILCLTCILSLYSFYTIGVYNLVPMHGIQ